MKKVMGLMAASALATSCAFAAPLNTPGASLINKLTAGKVSAVKEFEAPMGLQGYVVKAANGPKNIFYTSKDGKYLFSGNIVELGKDGKAINLSQNYYLTYITSEMAANALNMVKNTHVITDSTNAKAPAMYVLWDPNCAYCHLLYKELRPMIDAGKVQVKWLPVAIRPNSEAKTAEILAAKTDKDAIKLMEKDESKFDMKTEQGGLKGLESKKGAKKDSKADEKAFAEVKANTKFFIENSFMGTPVILYHAKNGKAEMLQGYAQKAQLTKLLEKVSTKW